QYVESDSRSQRTPFGLYRLAQLQFEFAEDLRKLSKGKEGEFFQHQRFALAISPLERIQKDFPSFQHKDATLYLLGYALIEDGQNEAAIRTFKQLTTEFPRNPLAPEVHLRIGEYYFERKKFNEAIPEYQKVLSFGFNYFYDKALYKLAWANYML